MKDAAAAAALGMPRPKVYYTIQHCCARLGYSKAATLTRERKRSVCVCVWRVGECMSECE